MKFFNETLQNLPFFGIQISFCTTLFSQIILKKKIKKKEKLYGVFLLFRICGKFWSVLLEYFKKQKPQILEEFIVGKKYEDSCWNAHTAVFRG